MALPAIIDQEAHDQLPDAIKGEYIKQPSGEFKLDVTPGGGLSLEDVSGLRNTVSKLTKSQKGLTEKLAAYGKVDVTPESEIEFEPLFTADQYTSIQSELDEAKEAAKEADPKKKIETAVEAATTRLRQELTTAHNAQVKELETQTQTAVQDLRKTRGEFTIQSAIAKHAPDAVDILMPLLKEKTGYDENDHPYIKDPAAEGQKLLVPSTGLPMTHDEYLVGLSKDEAFKKIFPAEKAGGSGEGDAGSGSGGSPEQMPAGIKVL